MMHKPANQADDGAPYIDAELESFFTYHRPKEGQATIYAEIRDAAKVFAYKVCRECPNGRERTQALVHLRAAVMWANAGIACAE